MIPLERIEIQYPALNKRLREIKNKKLDRHFPSTTENPLKDLLKSTAPAPLNPDSFDYKFLHFFGDYTMDFDMTSESDLVTRSLLESLENYNKMMIEIYLTKFSEVPCIRFIIIEVGLLPFALNCTFNLNLSYPTREITIQVASLDRFLETYFRIFGRHNLSTYRFNVGYFLDTSRHRLVTFNSKMEITASACITINEQLESEHMSNNTDFYFRLKKELENEKCVATMVKILSELCLAVKEDWSKKVGSDKAPILNCIFKRNIKRSLTSVDDRLKEKSNHYTYEEIRRRVLAKHNYELVNNKKLAEVVSYLEIRSNQFRSMYAANSYSITRKILTALGACKSKCEPADLFEISTVLFELDSCLSYEEKDVSHLDNSNMRALHAICNSYSILRKLHEIQKNLSYIFKDNLFAAPYYQTVNTESFAVREHIFASQFYMPAYLSSLDELQTIKRNLTLRLVHILEENESALLYFTSSRFEPLVDDRIKIEKRMLECESGSSQYASSSSDDDDKY